MRFSSCTSCYLFRPDVSRKGGDSAQESNDGTFSSGEWKHHQVATPGWNTLNGASLPKVSPTILEKKASLANLNRERVVGDSASDEDRRGCRGISTLFMPRKTKVV